MNRYVKKIGLLSCVVFSSPVVMASSGGASPLQSQAVVPSSKLFDMSLSELGSVEISTAGKKAERINDVPASVVLITREEIKHKGYQNLRQILAQIPGMYVLDNKTFHYVTLGVRGYWTQLSRNVIVMINGVNQTEKFHADYPYVWATPVKAIDRIEVIRGPMSVVYGSGAFFGAINIITNDRETNDKSSVVAGAGNRETYEAGAFIRNNTSDIRYALNTGYFTTDGVDQPYRKITSNLQPVYEAGIATDSTKGRYGRELKYVDLSAQYQRFNIELAHKEVERGFSFVVPNPLSSPLTEQEMNNIKISYRHPFNNDFYIENHLTYSLSEIRYHLPFVDEQNPEPYSQSNSEFWEFEFNGFYTVNQDLDMSFGFLYQAVSQHEQEGDFANLDNYQLAYDSCSPCTLSLFSQLNYQVSKKLRLVSGFRVESYADHDITYENNIGLTDEYGNSLQTTWKDTINHDDTNVTPRLAAIYAIDDSSLIKMLYGQAYMDSDILSNFDVLRVRNEYGDERVSFLDEEEITTYELIYERLHHIPFRQIVLNTQLNLFQNNLDKLVLRKEEFVNGRFITRSSNEGKIRTYGFEASLKVLNGKDWSGEAAVSYQDSSDQTTGRGLAFSPKWLANMSVTYHWNRNLLSTVTANYVDSMLSRFDNAPATNSPTQNPNSPDYIPVGRLGVETNDYVRFDLHMLYRGLFVPGLDLSMKVDNLFDVDIHTPTDAASAWADKGMMESGRSLKFVLSYDF
ncbi:TonB-dependent receptor plug domain-containing protein [Teredinibacter sp. KSP-S5-2]|uniref:TonB-dependent receptor plug domain-containing protein n=1 Tax=Teredinibacter sp. KSP-S5-2 TaxID=3034506 RepID=UPI0029345E60|nr:TonB-dependent receptor [Teredinibacter sp. KSP-S5-2]WNO11541.1 TonB-dependent receptor [Teredinibacter sp. KSP-S5-2]